MMTFLVVNSENFVSSNKNVIIKQHSGHILLFSLKRQLSKILPAQNDISRPAQGPLRFLHDLPARNLGVATPLTPGTPMLL